MRTRVENRECIRARVVSQGCVSYETVCQGHQVEGHELVHVMMLWDGSIGAKVGQIIGFSGIYQSCIVLIVKEICILYLFVFTELLSSGVE